MMLLFGALLSAVASIFVYLVCKNTVIACIFGGLCVFNVLAWVLNEIYPANETPLEEQIRKRAHTLWQKAGRPEDRSNEFWHEAERQIKNGT